MINKTTNDTNDLDNIKYLQDVTFSKFKVLGEILKQPIKKYELSIPDNLSKVLSSQIYIRHEYQNIYSIFGKLEILTDKVFNPVLILPDNLYIQADNSIVIHGICYSIKDHFEFINGVIQRNTLTFYPLNCLKPNIKTICEFNNLVCLPGKIPLHVNI